MNEVIVLCFVVDDNLCYAALIGWLIGISAQTNLFCVAVGWYIFHDAYHLTIDEGDEGFGFGIVGYHVVIPGTNL